MVWISKLRNNTDCKSANFHAQIVLLLQWKCLTWQEKQWWCTAQRFTHCSLWTFFEQMCLAIPASNKNSQGKPQSLMTFQIPFHLLLTAWKHPKKKWGPRFSNEIILWCQSWWGIFRRKHRSSHRVNFFHFFAVTPSESTVTMASKGLQSLPQMNSIVQILQRQNCCSWSSKNHHK